METAYSIFRLNMSISTKLLWVYIKAYSCLKLSYDNIPLIEELRQIITPKKC